MRVQAVRQKREATEGAVKQDAWTRHVVERSMLVVTNPDAARQHAAQQLAAQPEAAPVAAVRQEAAQPEVAPVPAPAASVDPRIEKNVSNNGMNTHDVALETCLRDLSWNQGSKGSGEPSLREVMAKGMAEAIAEGRAEARLAGQDVPTKGPGQS